jgi:hypothetical protein
MSTLAVFQLYYGMCKDRSKVIKYGSDNMKNRSFIILHFGLSQYITQSDLSENHCDRKML